MWVGVHSIAMIISVIISRRIPKNISKLHEIFCMLPAAMAQPSCNDGAVHDVLLVLWMTSCFCIMGHMEHGVGSNDMGTMLRQLVKIYSVFARGCHAIRLCSRIGCQQMVHRGQSMMYVITLFAIKKLFTHARCFCS